MIKIHIHSVTITLNPSFKKIVSGKLENVAGNVMHLLGKIQNEPTPLAIYPQQNDSGGLYTDSLVISLLFSVQFDDDAHVVHMTKNPDTEQS